MLFWSLSVKIGDSFSEIDYTELIFCGVVGLVSTVEAETKLFEFVFCLTGVMLISIFLLLATSDIDLLSVLRSVLACWRGLADWGLKLFVFYGDL